MRRGRTGHLEISNDIHGINPMKFFGRYGFQIVLGDWSGRRRIVYEDIDLSPFVDGRLRHLATILIAGYIRLNGNGFHAARDAFGGSPFRSFSVVHVVDDDVCAFRRQPLGAFGANSRSGA